MNKIGRDELFKMVVEAGFMFDDESGLHFCSIRDIERFADLILAAQQPPAVAIPAGYKLVPIEPTDEMLDDSQTALLMEGMDAATWLLQNTYRVMLVNAPHPPLVSADDLVAAEREACAKVAEGSVNATSGSKTHIAAAIRARSDA